MLRLIRAPEHKEIEIEFAPYEHSNNYAAYHLQFGDAGLGQQATAVPLARCFGSNTHMDQQLHAQFHALLGTCTDAITF
jgi:hypothetical protein